MDKKIKNNVLTELKKEKKTLSTKKMISEYFSNIMILKTNFSNNMILKTNLERKYPISNIMILIIKKIPNNFERTYKCDNWILITHQVKLSDEGVIFLCCVRPFTSVQFTSLVEEASGDSERMVVMRLTKSTRWVLNTLPCWRVAGEEDEAVLIRQK